MYIYKNGKYSNDHFDVMGLVWFLSQVRIFLTQTESKKFFNDLECTKLTRCLSIFFSSLWFANIDGPVPQVQGQPETAGKTLDFGILAGLLKIAS